MDQTQRSRPAGAAPYRSFAATETIVALPDAWHEQADFERDIAYAAGFRAGVEHARAVMEAAIREAIDPGPEVNPFARKAILSRAAKDVVRTLVDAMTRGEKQVSGPPSRPDYQGGPVVWREAA